MQAPCDTYSTVTKDRDDVRLGMYRLVNMLLPQRGVFQIVKDRLLAGTALLFALHPNNSIFHSNIQDKLQD